MRQVERDGLPGDAPGEGRVGIALSPDGANLYAAGVGEHGVAVCRLACEAADLIAAVAPVTGRVALCPLSTCQPSRLIGVIELAGLHDALVPYHENFSFSPSAPDSFAFWRATDGCDDGSPDERLECGASYCETYLSCAAGVQVEPCSVETSRTSCVVGHILYLNPDIDIARTVWEFLSPFRLPARPPGERLASTATAPVFPFPAGLGS